MRPGSAPATRGEGSNHRREIAPFLPHIFGPHQPQPDKTGRGVILLLADFLTDADPVLRAGLHRFRIQNDLPHGEMFR